MRTSTGHSPNAPQVGAVSRILLLWMIGAMAVMAAPAHAAGPAETVSADVWVALIPTTIVSIIGGYINWKAQRATVARDAAIEKLEAAVLDIRERFVRREEMAQLETRMQSALQAFRADIDDKLDRQRQLTERVDDKLEKQKEALAAVRETQATILADLRAMATLMAGSRA